MSGVLMRKLSRRTVHLVPETTRWGRRTSASVSRDAISNETSTRIVDTAWPLRLRYAVFGEDGLLADTEPPDNGQVPLRVDPP
jgi:hypothetical protein